MTITNQTFRIALLVALAIDLLLILLHIRHMPGVPEAFELSSEISIPSRLLYLKWAGVAGICALIWRRWHAPVFGSLALIFAVVLFDDMMMVHEKGGRRLVAALPDLPSFGLPRADMGEIYVFALIGLGLAGALLAGLLRSASVWRWQAARFLIPFAGLVAFAVGVDAIVAVLRLHWPDFSHLGLVLMLEDAGEMIFASLAVALAIGLWAGLSARLAPQGRATLTSAE